MSWPNWLVGRCGRNVLNMNKPHHRFLLTEWLMQIDALDEALPRLSNENAARLQEEESPSWALAIASLCTIPGNSRRAAEGILTKIGLDMAHFPPAVHVVPRSVMCPGNSERAGKRLSGKTRKGRPWQQTLLVEAARAAAHTKSTYLSVQNHR